MGWWQRRRYHAVFAEEMKQQQEEAIHRNRNVVSNTEPQDDDTLIISNQEEPCVSERLIFSSRIMLPRSSLPARRIHTGNSFDSIESLDSLVDSYWDAEDTESQSTVLVTNKNKKKDGSKLVPEEQSYRRVDAFQQHLSFLTTNVQPREVEVVYHNK